MPEINDFDASAELDKILKGGSDAVKTTDSGFDASKELDSLMGQVGSIESTPTQPMATPRPVISSTENMFPEVPASLREIVLDPAVDIASAAYKSVGGLLNTLDGIGDLTARAIGSEQFQGFDYLKSKIDEIQASLPETGSPAIGRFATDVVFGAPLAMAEWAAGGTAMKAMSMAGKATKGVASAEMVLGEFAKKYPQFSNVGKVLGSQAVNDGTRMGVLSALAEYGESNKDADMMNGLASGFALGAVFPAVGSAIELMKKNGVQAAEKYMEVLVGKKITADEIIKADLKTKNPKQLEDLKAESKAVLDNIKKENDKKVFEFKQTQTRNVANRKVDIKDSSDVLKTEIDNLKKRQVEEVKGVKEKSAIAEKEASSNASINMQKMNLSNQENLAERKSALASAIDKQNKSLADSALGIVDDVLKEWGIWEKSFRDAKTVAINSILEINPAAGDTSKNLMNDVYSLLSKSSFGGDELLSVYPKRAGKGVPKSLEVKASSSLLNTKQLSDVLTRADSAGRIGLGAAETISDDLRIIAEDLFEKKFHKEARIVQSMSEIFDLGKNPRTKGSFKELEEANRSFYEKKLALDEAKRLLTTPGAGGKPVPNTGSALDAIRGAGKGNRRLLSDLLKADKAMRDVGARGFFSDLRDLAKNTDNAIAQQTEALQTFKTELKIRSNNAKNSIRDARDRLTQNTNTEVKNLTNRYSLELLAKEDNLAKATRRELVTKTSFSEKRRRSLDSFERILDGKFEIAKKQLDEAMDFASKERMMRSWRAGVANPSENMMRNVQNILGLGQIFGSLGGLNVPVVATGTGVMAALSPRVGARISKKLIEFSRKPAKEKNETLKTLRSLMLLKMLKPQ